jgi:hypothetical protein
MLTLLQIVQAFCERNGFTSPDIVAASVDDTVIQYKALLNAELDYIVQRWKWQGINVIGGFTTVATQSQGLMTDLADDGILYLVKDTIWDQTLRLPVYGPVTASEWEMLMAMPTTGPYYQYRINAGEFLMNPVPPAGHTIAWEYISQLGVRAADGTLKRYFTADDDTPVLSDTLFMAALEWRYLAKKKLEYAEEFRQYEELALNAFSRDGTKPNINMGGSVNTIKPGIMVPIGNWDVS